MVEALHWSSGKLTSMPHLAESYAKAAPLGFSPSPAPLSWWCHACLLFTGHVALVASDLRHAEVTTSSLQASSVAAPLGLLTACANRDI